MPATFDVNCTTESTLKSVTAAFDDLLLSADCDEQRDNSERILQWLRNGGATPTGYTRKFVREVCKGALRAVAV